MLLQALAELETRPMSFTETAIFTLPLCSRPTEKTSIPSGSEHPTHAPQTNTEHNPTAAQISLALTPVNRYKGLSN